MDELVTEFLQETNDSLADLDTQLVSLEQNPEDREIIDSIFRVMHTIKGTCGFLGLDRLASIAHSAEDVLDNVRSDKLTITPDIVSVVLSAIDLIKEIMEILEETGEEPQGDDSELVAKLKAAAEGNVGGAPAEAAPAVEAPTAEAPSSETPTEGEEAGQDSVDLQAAFDAAPGPDDEATPAPAAPATEEAGQDNADLQAAFDAAPGPDDEATPAPAAPATEASESPPPPAAKEEAKPPQATEDAKKEAVDKGLKTAKQADASANQSIRVNLGLLENLMQMASELVLTRNQLLQINRKVTDSAFSTPLQRLSNITTDLQESVMKTRMQPIGNAWAKFPRLIRDLSIDVKKKIELKMVGADTELDRQMLEMVKDPLTHMVRNAADHGLDTPEERLAAGKDETGTVTLSSYHEGGHIIVKISDDGRGINVDKVKAKAIENGLTTETEAANLTDKQIYQFIFKPGFSTAEKVTAVSGRGVGMDVVVSNIEKIGGTVEVDSIPGKGSDFVIKLPLTLAIMSVLIVESRGMTFAIPQIRVSEIVHAVPKSQHDTERKEDEFIIETIKETSVLRLRGRLLPLITLGDLLELEEPDIPLLPNLSSDSSNKNREEKFGLFDDEETNLTNESGKEDDSSETTEELEVDYRRKFVVVCEVGSSYFGIIVDRVFDTEEIVVKPKSPFINGIEVYSGCTILGDGGVIMILDPNGIMKTMGNVSALAGPAEEEEKQKTASFGGRFDVASEDEEVSFLLFKAGGKAPKSVPLELVSRLEEIDMSTAEWAGDKMVVQYREHLMRLITSDDSYSIPTEGLAEVIVFNDEGKILGLVVEEVLDITQHRMDIRSITGHDGVLGSMVLNGITFDLIDVGYYFSTVFSDWLANKSLKDSLEGVDSETSGQKKLLLVDDSPFFRKFMKPILVVADYSVTTADSAKKAIEILEAGNEFSAVVTDIDMPEMTGVEFVKYCKAKPEYADLPFIALTSYTSEEIMEKEGDVGFSGFVSKSDRDKLVDTINEVFNSLSEQREAS